MKEKTKIILIFITLLISLLSLFLSVLSLASFIYLQDLHTKTTVTSSNTQMMLLERILCLEGDKEACEPGHQEKHQNN